MNLIRASIDRPIAVIAAVLIAVLFGSLALSRIPIQLAPDVRKPIVVVENRLARCRSVRGRARDCQLARRNSARP